MKVRFQKLDPKAIIPEYNFSDDSGFDLRSVHEQEITFGEVTKVRTGLAVELPFLPPFVSLPEYDNNGKVSWTMEMQIRPRSGLAAREGLMVVNSPGTIDHGYRGEIIILLTRCIPGTFFVSEGERIAQGVLAPVFTQRSVEFEEVDWLHPSTRNAGGMGSTGTQ